MKGHRHVCACGAVLLCKQEPDHCDIRNWDCPTCLDNALDAYLTLLESELNRTQQEPTREYQQRVS